LRERGGWLKKPPLFYYLSINKKNMAKDSKQKPEKVIESVTLKNPNEPLDLPRIGMYIDKDNLTVERYKKLVAISSEFEQYFNVKLTNKSNEQITEVGS